MSAAKAATLGDASAASTRRHFAAGSILSVSQCFAVWVTTTGTTVKVQHGPPESSGLPRRKGDLALLQLAAQLPSPEAS